MSRRLAVLALAACTLVTFGGIGIAGAQEYPPSGCSLALSQSVVAPGETLTVSTTSGCSGVYVAGTTVTITLGSVTLTTVTTDANGLFSTSVTIPSDTAPGEYTVSASGAGTDGSTVVLNATLRVEAADDADEAGALPVTGSDAVPFVWIGIAALVAGAVLVIGVRRWLAVRARVQ